ncbi:MAG: hypothetical protein HXX11_10110 [Desulfuromonadales bacterium]|nr:hypothetical protein [Desulfuromonadales bacterium]
MDTKLRDSMVNFQYLEFTLRVAVKQFELLIQNTVTGYMKYPVEGKHLDRMALGKLLEQYAKYTGNKQFKVMADKIIESRNKLAHALYMKKELSDNSTEIEI